MKDEWKDVMQGRVGERLGRRDRDEKVDGERERERGGNVERSDKAKQTIKSGLIKQKYQKK